MSDLTTRQRNLYAAIGPVLVWGLWPRRHDPAHRLVLRAAIKLLRESR